MKNPKPKIITPTDEASRWLIFLSVMEISEYIIRLYGDMMPRLILKDLRSFPIPPDAQIYLKDGLLLMTDRFLFNKVLTPWGLWQFLDSDQNSRCIGLHRVSLETGLLRCNAKIINFDEKGSNNFKCFVEKERLKKGEVFTRPTYQDRLADKKFKIGYRLIQWQDRLFGTEPQPDLSTKANKQNPNDLTDEWDKFFNHHQSIGSA